MMTNHIKAAADVLRNGGLILYPTDTVWGIGCDATNPEAVAKVYKLKQREDYKGMLVLIENPDWLNIYMDTVPEIALNLIEVAHRPLTIIYPNARNLASNLIAPDGSIGIRIVRHPFCEQLIRVFGKPIVSTSANLSGQPLPGSFGEIDRTIVNGVDMVVPEEYCTIHSSSPSGIIRVGLRGEVEVIRQ